MDMARAIRPDSVIRSDYSASKGALAGFICRVCSGERETARTRSLGAAAASARQLSRATPSTRIPTPPATSCLCLAFTKRRRVVMGQTPGRPAAVPAGVQGARLWSCLDRHDELHQNAALSFGASGRLPPFRALDLEIEQDSDSALASASACRALRHSPPARYAC